MSDWQHQRNISQQPPTMAGSYHPLHVNQTQRGDYYSTAAAAYSNSMQPLHQPHSSSSSTPLMQSNTHSTESHPQHHASQSNCMCCPPRSTGPYGHHSQPVYSDYHPATMASDIAADRHTNNNIDDRNSEYFPQDPREWSDIDVSKWLHWAARRYSIPDTHPERFQMNGKALCLMDLSMFVYRVQDGGDLLYQDFQGRLQQVLYDDRSR